LLRYDGLISGWSGMLDRYKTLGTPPVVVFVCEDEVSAMNLVRIPDRVLTSQLAKPGTEQTEWPHPAEECSSRSSRTFMSDPSLRSRSQSFRRRFA
jgi:hypothetical protein